MRADRQWIVDKRIPLPMLLAVGLQTAIAIWWAASFSASISGRVDQLEKQAAPIATQAERLIRVETKLESMGEALTEIKNLLRQVPTRAAP